MKEQQMREQQEKGFVLVITIVMLGMLGMLGATAAWKSSVQTKISGLSGKSSQALAAANAGIQKQFLEWGRDANVGTPDGDRTELVHLIDHILNNTNVTRPSVYLPTETPTGIDDFRTNFAGGDIDTHIQSSSGIRVFELTPAGIQLVANNQWGDPKIPQVAVWATSFKDTDKSSYYPYLLPNTDVKCTKCSIVLYALGAHQGTYRMVRQKVSTVDNKLYGVAAMTNAPSGANYADICAGGGTSPTSSNVTPWDPLVSGPGGNGSAVIEVTQAVYKLKEAPSGNAIISNTDLGIGKKGFRKDVSSKTGASFESAPYVVYSGHGTTGAVKVDWVDMARDTTGVDLPAKKLPKNLVAAPLMANKDTKVQFFSGDGTAQLFSMPTYRWAAEQFTCQTLSWPPVPNALIDGQNGNGMFCSKGEALRQALANMGYTPRAPVTGRLTLADFQYNVANNIPMFGMVRVMFPAEPMGVAGGCGELHQIEQPGNNAAGADFNKLVSGTGDKVYDGGTANVILDGDGDLGPTARLIVYGSLLIDYFADYDIEGVGGAANPADKYNAIFNPASGERFLTPVESPDVYLAIELNIMINPVMPNFVGGNPQAFPTAARGGEALRNAAAPSRLNIATDLNVATNTGLNVNGQMNMVDLDNVGDPAQANRVHLASPYEGYFPWAEGLVPRNAGIGLTGTMRLMSRSTKSGLVAAMQDIQAKPQPAAIPTPRMKNLLNQNKPVRTAAPTTKKGKESGVLRYYYRLMVEGVQHGTSGDTPSAQAWPIAPWPGSLLGGNFYMGEEDKKLGNNDGDKMHLIFPTGYAHGWKVALAALDMSASEWNHILSGSALAGIGDPGGLYDQLVGGCGGGGCARGLPMSSAEPEFANRAAVQTIQTNEDDYFFVTTDSLTGYGLIDADWRDIPSTMYSGGLLDMHAHSNMNGIIYSPGPLEWEPGNSKYDAGKTQGHLSYVSGSIISGFGQYTKNKRAMDRYVIVFEKQAVDNITARNVVVILRQHSWQELR